MIRVVVAINHEQGRYWNEELQLGAVLIASHPKQLLGVRADELHIVGQHARLSFEMHHAMTKVKKPAPHGRDFPEVIFH